MGGVLAVGVVQKTEDVPLPLIFDVFRGSWDDSRGWFRQWRRAENERKQTLRQPHMVAFLYIRSQHITKGAASSLEQATRDHARSAISRQFGQEPCTATPVPELFPIVLPCLNTPTQPWSWRSQVILAEMISTLTEREALWCKFWPHELLEAMVGYLLTPGDCRTPSIFVLLQ